VAGESTAGIGGTTGGFLVTSAQLDALVASKVAYMEATLADRVMTLARRERADEERRLLSAAMRSQDEGADFLSMQRAAVLRETLLTNADFFSHMCRSSWTWF
jgi:hypothetical protein